MFFKKRLLSCQTRIFSGEPFFKWTQPSNKQFKAASKHVDEIRTIYDCGKIKMNPKWPIVVRSCFELFEMFFEVKNLHFLPASSVR